MPRIIATFEFTIPPNDSLEIPLYRDAPFLVDGTHVPIKNFCDTAANRASYRMRFWSWKLKGMALAYQVVYNPWLGKVCSVFGPVPASVHDSVMFERSGVGGKLEGLGKKCLADGGYAGGHNLVIPYARRRRLEAREQQHNYTLSTCRWQVETFFSRMKNFLALSTPWRHDVSKHRLVFFFVAGIVQHDLRTHPLQMLEQDEQEVDEEDDEHREEDY